MEHSLVRTGYRRAIATSHNPAKRRVFLQPRRYYATPYEAQQSQNGFSAAPPFQSRMGRNRASRGRPQAQLMGEDEEDSFGGRRGRNDAIRPEQQRLLRRVRIVPASPSYFTATPRYTDDLLHLSALLRRHQLLPQLPPGEAPRVAWKTIAQYKAELQEPVRSKGFNILLELLKRLNYIHPSLIPPEVTEALDRYKRLVQPHINAPKPIEVDRMGRAAAIGRRKSSSAKVTLVEGEGECLVNGRSMTDYFGRLHDRESALWALKATKRLDKYNVWALVRGGGTTGQAEAITLAVAKALLAHEPALKPALRLAGVVTRNPKRVERKKPGKLKARKMPAWVKR